MPPKALSEQVEGLIAAIPATGEVDYRTLHEQVKLSENSDALGQIHSLKRQGRIKMRTEIDANTGKAVTFVSRA